MRVCACAFVYVKENKQIGTTHQLSTCSQRCAGLMTGRFVITGPPSIRIRTLSYLERSRGVVVSKIDRHMRSIINGGGRDMAIIITISYQSYCVHTSQSQ